MSSAPSMTHRYFRRHAGGLAELKLALSFLRDAQEPDNDRMLSSYQVAKWQGMANESYDPDGAAAASVSLDRVGATISSLLSLADLV